MKKFLTLLAHELKLQIDSYKFFLFLSISIIVTIFCVHVQVKDYNIRYKSYIEEVNKVNKSKKDVFVYSEYKYTIVIPPNPLSIFVKGYDEAVGNKIILSTLDVPELISTIQKDNPFLGIFSNFDVVSFIKIILSLIVLLISCDLIIKEKEDNTIRLIFINNVSRIQFFVSKYFATLLVSIIPLILIFAISSIMIVYNNIITNYEFWIKFFLIFLNSILYFSFLILVALFISSTISSSSKATALGLSLWLLITIIYPNTVSYIISEFWKPPSEELTKSEVEQLRNDFNLKYIEWQKYNPQPYSSYSYYVGNRFFATYIGLTNKEAFEYESKKVSDLLPNYVKTLENIALVKNTRELYLIRQKQIVDNLSIFLPNVLFGIAQEKLAATDIETRKVKLFKDALIFRSTEYMDYLKSKNAFGLKYFTQIPIHKMKNSIEEYSENDRQIYSGLNAFQPINIDDSPNFNFKIKFFIPIEMVLLLIVNAIMFTLGCSIFVKSKLII